MTGPQQRICFVIIERASLQVLGRKRRKVVRFAARICVRDDSSAMQLLWRSWKSKINPLESPATFRLDLVTLRLTEPWLKFRTRNLYFLTGHLKCPSSPFLFVGLFLSSHRLSLSIALWQLLRCVFYILLFTDAIVQYLLLHEKYCDEFSIMCLVLCTCSVHAHTHVAFALFPIRKPFSVRNKDTFKSFLTDRVCGERLQWLIFVLMTSSR